MSQRDVPVMSVRVRAVIVTGMVLSLALVVALGGALIHRRQTMLAERRRHTRTRDAVTRLAALSAAYVALYELAARETGLEVNLGPGLYESQLPPFLVRAWTFERSVIVDGEHDAWGVRLRLKTTVDRGIRIPPTITSRHERLLVYSCGPDRRDEGGHGDDVACDHAERHS